MEDFYHSLKKKGDKSIPATSIMSAISTPKRRGDRVRNRLDYRVRGLVSHPAMIATDEKNESFVPARAARREEERSVEQFSLNVFIGTKVAILRDGEGRRGGEPAARACLFVGDGVDGFKGERRCIRVATLPSLSLFPLLSLSLSLYPSFFVASAIVSVSTRVP